MVSKNCACSLKPASKTKKAVAKAKKATPKKTVAKAPAKVKAPVKPKTVKAPAKPKAPAKVKAPTKPKAPAKVKAPTKAKAKAPSIAPVMPKLSKKDVELLTKTIEEKGKKAVKEFGERLDKAKAKVPTKTSVNRAVSPMAAPSTKIRPWYMAKFPSDELGAKINPTLTFSHVWSSMKKGVDYYTMLPGDSVVRERVFDGISDAYKIPYDTVYETWLNGRKLDKHVSIVSIPAPVKAPVPTVKAPVQPVAGLEGWQMEVLTSPYITIYDQDKVQIYKVSKEHAEPINEIVDRLKKVGNKKPIIMNPHEFLQGRYANKQTVIKVLMSRPDYRKSTIGPTAKKTVTR